MNFQQLRDFLWIALIPALLASPLAKAEVIEFPEEELATESVLPKFDKPDVVKNRNVTTAGKWEVAPYIGYSMTEPIYNPMKFGLNVGYHWNEESAVMINLIKYNTGLNTQYTDALTKVNNLDYSRVPKLNYSAYANYEYKVYYGKISLTKQGTMNLTTYPIMGGGLTAFEHKTYFGANGGIGQKFYFTQSFGLRIDLKLQYSQAPSPFLGGGKLQTANPRPAPGDFEDKWGFSTLLDVGVTFVF